MFYYIKGELVHTDPTTAVVDCSGIGYKMTISKNTLSHLTRLGEKVCLYTYFYVREDALDLIGFYSEAELEALGIRVVAPRYANTNVDLPALPAESYRLVQDKSTYGIMDIGGDDRGAYALGRYVSAIKAENDYRMAFVVNCYRSLTQTVEDTVEIMREIEAACGLEFNCIVNNSNLGDETTAKTVLDSLDFVERLSEQTGLEVWMHTAKESVAEQLKTLSVMPMTLQKKLF